MLSILKNNRRKGGAMAKLKVIAGPCVIESEEHLYRMAKSLRDITVDFDVDWYFKASFDKANRTCLASYRGPGFRAGIKMLWDLREELNIKTTTDFHEADQIIRGAYAVNVVQIPAFLCRQTDLLTAAGRYGEIVNIKKGQFANDDTMRFAKQKVGDAEVWFTERGTNFGDRVVIDFQNFQMRDMIADVTHPAKSRSFAPNLARAAIAMGAVGVFMEVHDLPNQAKCDGENSVWLSEFREILRDLTELWDFLHKRE